MIGYNKLDEVTSKMTSKTRKESNTIWYAIITIIIILFLSMITYRLETLRDNTIQEEKKIRRLPTALIIGAKKSGTRALLEFMKAHPQVKALAQEAHFFDKQYDKGLEWYRRRMPATKANHLVVEKTPSYFITKMAPRRVFKMSPHTKLLVVVRDPVTRAISDYAQALEKRPDLQSFEKMAISDNGIFDNEGEDMDEDAILEEGHVNQKWGVIRIGLYARHLRRWLNYFPRSSFHFISGERLISDPSKELSGVEKFLGLEPFITDKHFYFNSTKGFPCIIHPVDDRRQCLGKSKGRQHPIVHRKVIQKLREFYSPRNKKFYDLSGQDFGWT